MEESSTKKIGTTQRGIGPCYADKCLRTGIRVGDVLEREGLVERISRVLEMKNNQLEKLYGKKAFAMNEITDILDRFRAKAGNMIVNTQAYLHQSLKMKKRILLEGAQGYALDIDHGTYPFVTSSNPTIGGALMGTGLNSFDIERVIGITKAYVTRVGEGPFPTEDTGPDGDRLRVNGGEFGSTTGRPRRCGWFDVELLKQSAMTNGLTGIAFTKLDVLSGFKKIKVAVSYEINGKKVDYFPGARLHEVKPVYEELEGWNENLSECRDFNDLPSAAKTYVSYIEKQIGVPIEIVSIGAGREKTIVMK